jgi:hypothetical protein
LKQGVEEGTIRPAINTTCFAVECNTFIFGLAYRWLVSRTFVDPYSVFYCYRRSTLEMLAEWRV